jgi:uncharacterized protein
MQKARIASFWMLTLLPFLGLAQNTLLFEIQGKGLKAPSYVFGTMHLVCPDRFQTPEKVKTSLGKVEQLVLELDMGSPKFKENMQKALLYPEGQDLQKNMTPKAFDSLKTWFSENAGIDLAKLKQMKPLGLMSFMYMKMLNCMPQSVEDRLVAIVAEIKKPVIGLESAAFQANLFEGAGDPAEMVMELVRKPKEANAELDTLVSLYEKEDVDGLFRAIQQSRFSGEGFQKTLLEDRNKAWIPKIEALCKEKASFIAVGAGHLGGPLGLIELLKKQGFTVTPVK